MKNQSQPGKETCAGSLRPVTYVFGCGCELPEKAISRIKNPSGTTRFVNCPKHKSATLMGRIVDCVDCGTDLKIRPVGKMKSRCDSCNQKRRNQSRKEYEARRRIIDPTEKIHVDLSRVDCVHWISCLDDVIAKDLPNRPCAICTKYESDPSPYDIILSGSGYDARYYSNYSGLGYRVAG